MLIQTLQGDCREVLKGLADNSVNCCVTSPPYFGLRDYGTAEWEGGEPGCQHNTGGRKQVPQTKHKAAAVSIVAGGNRGASKTCIVCGAIRIDGQIGLEETPAEYVQTLLDVFREVKRILRPDGTCWLNLGDTWSTDGKWGGGKTNAGKNYTSFAGGYRSIKKETGLAGKQLIGIPWRVAFALQDDGWWLRSEIIWAKPNAMPESVTDRPSKAHEQLFLLTKSAKYFYDYEAIREPQVKGNAGSGFSTGKTAIHQLNRASNNERIEDGFRNKRSVWTVPSQPYSGSHFATFPEKLIEPCILAGCPVGGTVLDPFGGSGTTGRVAAKFERNAILIELNPEYHKLIDERTDKVQVKMVI